MLHDYLTMRGMPRGLRDHARDPARDAGATVTRDLARFARGIRRARHRVCAQRRVRRVDSGGASQSSTTAARCPTTFSSAFPSTAPPTWCSTSGMAEDGYIPVESAHARDARFPDVYAVGDVATIGVPKAGVFSEGAARVVAAGLIAKLRGEPRARRVRRVGLLLHRVRRRVGWAASTLTFSQAPDLPAPTRSPRRRLRPRRSISGRVGAPPGLAYGLSLRSGRDRVRSGRGSVVSGKGRSRRARAWAQNRSHFADGPSIMRARCVSASNMS